MYLLVGTNSDHKSINFTFTIFANHRYLDTFTSYKTLKLIFKEEILCTYHFHMHFHINEPLYELVHLKIFFHTSHFNLNNIVTIFYDHALGFFLFLWHRLKSKHHLEIEFEWGRKILAGYGPL